MANAENSVGGIEWARATAVAIGLTIGTGLEGGMPLSRNEDGAGTWQGCQPENTSIDGNSSALEYARLIEPELGVPPVVDCGAGVEQPIYVDGVATTGNPGLHQCDNPSLQIGDCMSGSSVQRYVGTNPDGSTRRDVVWASFCRHDGRGDVFGFDIGDSVQMIGYNKVTGATAFFESADNREWTYVDSETNRLLGKLPGIDDPRSLRQGLRQSGDPVRGLPSGRSVHPQPPSSMARRGPTHPIGRSFLGSAAPQEQEQHAVLCDRRCRLGHAHDPHRRQRVPGMPPHRHEDGRGVHGRSLAPEPAHAPARPRQPGRRLRGTAGLLEERAGETRLGANGSSRQRETVRVRS